MTSKHSGSCLCGAVTFEIEGTFDRFMLCHCSRCRKFSGTAHASNLFCDTGTLTFLSGEEKIRHFDVPGTRFLKAFCADCGSPLPRVRGEGVAVPAGCLDTPVDIAPTAHIFFCDRANWEEGLDACPKFDGYPK
ncbi:GFA family protein [Oricola thermophila]|uniref:GFA family protein n=1 Tax=Oricola thermophila TaxID=2742145 RepID=A0A6N1V8D9_9HYPH|nr:GFA family protein [Oricola thermophila]QKV17231.1 GFA family protein [Oricola thermophila]